MGYCLQTEHFCYDIADDLLGWSAGCQPHMIIMLLLVTSHVPVGLLMLSTP